MRRATLPFFLLVGAAFAACSDLPSAPSETLDPSTIEGVVGNAPVGVVTRIRVTPETSSVAQREKVQLVVEAWDGNGSRVSDPDVRWRSSNPDVAVVTTHGAVYARDRDGTATIHAWIGDGGSGEDTHTITVGAGGDGGSSSGSGARISLSGSSSVQPGGSIELSVRVFDAAGNQVSNPDVKWRSSNPDVAVVTTQGVVRAGDVDGTTTIHAWLATDGDVSASHDVTVGAGGGDGGGGDGGDGSSGSGARIELSGASSVGLGGSTQISVQVFDANGNRVSNPDLGWRSSNPDVAVVTSHGEVRASDVEGTTTIHAWLRDGSDLRGTHDVTVGSGGGGGSGGDGSGGGSGGDGSGGDGSIGPVARIRLSPGSSSAQPGESVQLTVEAWDADGDRVPNPDVNWRSSNPDVAIVTSSGIVWARDQQGTATIRAWIANGGSGEASHEITVGSGGSSGPETGGMSRSGGNGQTAQVATTLSGRPTVRVVDGSGRAVSGATVRWQVRSGGGSLNTGSTTTNSSGEAQVTWTLGTTAGRQEIVASTDGASSLVFNATANPGPVARINVAPGSSSLDVGGTIRLSAEAWDQYDNRISGPDVSWSTSASGVATVGTGGLVTAVSAGSATIRGTSNGHSDTHSVTVSDQGSTSPGAGQFHEPSGYTTLIDEEWNNFDAGWYHQVKNVGDVGIRNGKLRWDYAAGMEGGYDPGGRVVMDFARHGPYEYHRDEGVTLSSNFHGHQSGVNKFRFWSHDRPHAYIAFIGPDDQRLTLGLHTNGWTMGARALRWNSADNYASPTLDQSTVTRGQPHTIETLIYVGTPGGSDGWVKAWLDGVLVLDFRNMAMIPADEPAIITQIHYSPVWGGMGDVLPVNQSLSVERSYVSYRK